jgi:hypothetical protein
MSTETIIQNEYVTLMYHPEKKIVHHIFHRPVQGEVFRATLNTGLEVFKTHGAHKWLSDDLKNGVLPEEDSEWAKTVWFPRVLEAGWQYWALVWPPSTLAMLNMKDFIDTYRPFGLRVMVFKSAKPAMTWLERNHATPKIKSIELT